MIYQLKATLQDTRPPIWRRLHVHADISFAQLHHILQIAFEWDNTHLHEFAVGKGGYRVAIGVPEYDVGWADFYDEETVCLTDWFVQVKDSCQYTYDFGDDWKHLIVLEKILPEQAGTDYPLCVKARRDAPEEDNLDLYDENTVEREPADIVQDVNTLLRARQEALRPGSPKRKNRLLGELL